MDLFAAIAAERRDLADLLEGLTPDQQDTQSLCSAWTVRDVAGHLIMPMEVSLPKVIWTMLRYGGNFDRANDVLAKKQAQRPFNEIVHVLRDKADSRFTPPGKGPEMPLTDVLVHSLDIARPLGLSREIPAERLVAVLDYLVSPAGKDLAPGHGLDEVRLEADDLDWSHGKGRLVTGSAQTLLLALAGRDVTLSRDRRPTNER